jgi:hypothetical protein
MKRKPKPALIKVIPVRIQEILTELARLYIVQRKAPERYTPNEAVSLIIKLNIEGVLGDEGTYLVRPLHSELTTNSIPGPFHANDLFLTQAIAEEYRSKLWACSAGFYEVIKRTSLRDSSKIFSLMSQEARDPNMICLKR